MKKEKNIKKEMLKCNLKQFILLKLYIERIQNCKLKSQNNFFFFSCAKPSQLKTILF